ncbi:ankyrin repeat domain-containing protein 49 [Spea bombifrons]|uniref:ankyrin repeat domain-containing protein 49 n=1 Tax=Spea bombifrons TaxID=233779 RepID=UPI00234A8A11|nr:ankyrin repeat domain-containing protein 49 [Spea bombifrons]
MTSVPEKANTALDAVSGARGDEDDPTGKDENAERDSQDKLTEFPEDFNQLELLETHGHLIPTGTQSHWPEQSDEDDDEKPEEWYQMQEKALEPKPAELILFAAENNRLSTVQSILSSAPELVNATDEDHYTPLHRASYNGHLGMVRELIGRGADVHAVTLDDWTPLHSACKWNNTPVASFLLQHGADVNAQTKGLLTPLHLAAGNRDSRQLLELLLMNRYVKPSLKNKAGETAYDIARRTDVYHYLFEIAHYWIGPSAET